MTMRDMPLPESSQAQFGLVSKVLCNQENNVTVTIASFNIVDDKYGHSLEFKGTLKFEASRLASACTKFGLLPNMCNDWLIDHHCHRSILR